MAGGILRLDGKNGIFFPIGIRNSNLAISLSMKSQVKIAFLLCALAFLPLLCANATTFQVQVGASGLKFTPASITIQPGDTIQWVWAANGHSTTSGTPGNPDGLWDSGIQNNGFTFSYTFNTAGTFNYYCSPHGQCCGMVGTVTVSSG